MLAESLSSAPAFSQSALGWLVFVALVATAGSVIPMLAWILRRRLPASRRDPIPLDPVAFGTSPKIGRSPRHAVIQHRTLMLAVFIALLAMILLPGIAMLRSLGVTGLQAMIALVLPTLLVALHARPRNTAR
jgi:hypothetical protein